MTSMTRQDVFTLIDGEREYQARRWPGHAHHAGAYLTYLWHYYRLAEHADSTINASVQYGQHWIKCGGNMRKLAALAVACMEENGVMPHDPLFLGADWAYPKARKASRETVYAVIDLERRYQENGAGGKFGAPRRKHETSELLTMLRTYLNAADTAWTTRPGAEAALDVVRKIAAIAVRYIELYGAPARVE